MLATAAFFLAGSGGGAIANLTYYFRSDTTSGGVHLGAR
jgi:hypothetical protein